MPLWAAWFDGIVCFQHACVHVIFDGNSEEACDTLSSSCCQLGVKQFLSRGGTSHAAVGCAVATLIWEHLAVTRLRVPGVAQERGSCMPLWAAWFIVGIRPDSIIGTRLATECPVSREKRSTLVCFAMVST